MYFFHPVASKKPPESPKHASPLHVGLPSALALGEKASSIVVTIQQSLQMISNFFILSPRGDTIISKQYRSSQNAHERSHTDAFFRKIKFWDDMIHSMDDPSTVGQDENENSTIEDNINAGTDKKDETSGSKRKSDAPPVFIMPDGLSYLHVKRNGLIFGCSTARNISPCTVIEVRLQTFSSLLSPAFQCVLSPISEYSFAAIK